jgi:ATP-dependent Clp protease protease subunit
MDHDESLKINLPGLGPDVYRFLAEKRHLFLTGEVNYSLANHIISHLLLLDSQSSDAAITIIINSEGGDIEGGLLSIYDAFQYVKSPIQTFCIGEAYSAAGFLLAAGTIGKRFAFPHAKIMLHGVQVSDLSGTQEEINRENRSVKDLNRTLCEILAKHTGQSIKKITKELKKDKYFTAEEALKYGIIDKIVTSLKE